MIPVDMHLTRQWAKAQCEWALSGRAEAPGNKRGRHDPGPRPRDNILCKTGISGRRSPSCAKWQNSEAPKTIP